MPQSPQMLDQVLATLDVRLLGGNRTSCNRSWAPAHRSWADTFGRLYWPHTGAGWAEHHGRRFHLRPGVLFLIPAQVAARYYCPQTMELYWLHFSATVLHSLDLFTYLAVPYEIPIADTVWMDRLWDEFVSRQQSGGIGTPVAQEGFVRLLLALFLDRYDITGQQHTLQGLAQFHTVLGYIEAHLAERLSLTRLAEVTNLHPSYFSTLFTRTMGIGPTAYVNQRRIEQAKRLLRETTDMQEAIAAAVGFCDTYYFSRLFKRLTGMPPGQYRRLSAAYHP